MKYRLVFFLLTIFMFINSVSSYAQCAMCRATLENNVSNGEIGIAAKLNYGILYLFAMPYILVGVIAYLWFKNKKVILHEKRSW